MTFNRVKLIIAVVGLVMVAGLQSCGNKAAKSGEKGEKQEMLDAKMFTITSYKGYKVVDVVNPWKDSSLLHRYILVDKKAEMPKNLPAGDVVRVPVQSTACLYSVFVGSLDLLGVLNTINSVAEERYIDNQKVKERIAKGEIELLGEASAVNVEKLISASPEIILASPFKNMGYGRMEKTGIPIVEVASYMEETPLARTEWLKFFAVFFGKEKVADSVYNAIRERYNHIKSLGENATPKPTLFAEKKFGQVWNVPGGNSYMGTFFKDAGAAYLWADTPKSGSIPLSFEAVYQKAEKADYWLIKYNQPKDMTYDDIKKEYAPYALFKAYKEHHIIYCNTFSASYYEQGVLEPDVILADLLHIFHPDRLPDHKPVYFKLMK